MSANRQQPVLMIGVDASEVTLIEKWTADGTLPHLAALRQRGSYGRLASTVDWLVGTPWPSFYTSSWPSDHGFFNYLQWRSQLMTHHRPSDDWLPLRPFWRELAPQSIRTVTIDVPVSYAPKSFDGVEVCGWGSHDKLWPPASHPPQLLRSVEREFGAPPIQPEVTGLQRVRELLRLRDQLVNSTTAAADMALALMQRHPWDLFTVVLGATHRGGHKLWSDTGISDTPTPEEKQRFDAALRDVYVACDKAVGRLLEAAPREAHIMVFALHGMGVNTSRYELMPRMLEMILNDAKAAAPSEKPKKLGLLKRVRQMVPLEWRSAVKRQLPQKLQDQLALFWRKDQRPDWAHTVAFTTMGDMEGYVQINLKGREAEGIVDPADYEALLQRIADGLRTFVDEDTGKPIVARIGRPHELYPAGDNIAHMADLTVCWNDTPAHLHRAVVSPQFGRIDWPTPNKNPDGRGGHHRGTGWLMMAGPAATPGSTIEAGHILDLAPTALALLDAEQPYPMRGKPLVPAKQSIN